MVMTDVFLEKLNYDVNMIAKMVIIFAEIEHIKNQRVTFCCILHSPTGPVGLLMDSWWTPDGLLVDSW
jgi:hypothetical protein